MPRISHLAAACALALSAQAAQAQQFSGVISFGDSLTDAGNVSTIDGNPATVAGNSFTTNNDLVAAQLIAGAFGFNQQHSVIGGTNYAWGGSCAQFATSATTPLCVAQPIAVGPNLFYFARLNQQIAQHLNGGRADSNALYTVLSGANDIFANLAIWGSDPNPAIAQATIRARAGDVGTAVLTNVTTLETAGARYIVVFNLPDLARTPQFNTLPAAQQGAANLASISYNEALNAGLAGRQNIIPINTFALVNEAIANPAYFGFTNVTTVACIGGSSLACGAAGSGNPINYAAGTNNTFLFADPVHPTGAGHRLLANVVVATLKAPGQVSLAGELPLQVYEDHSGAIGQAMLSNKVGEAEVGTSRGFFQAQFGNQDYEATVNSPGLSTNSNTFTGGFEYQYSEGLSFGAAVSLGGSNGDFSGGDIDGQEVLGSVFATAHFGKGYLNSVLSLGSSSIDISRQIVLGPSTRVEEGNARASHKAFELGGGILFGDTLRHGPFLSVAWQKVGVDGYDENGGGSTSMRFDGFDRDSLIGRIGYQLQGNFGGDRSIRPTLRVAYASENEDDAVNVTAGSTSMNGQFTLAGIAPSEDWIEADLSINVEFTDKVEGFLGYHGRLSDDNQDNNSFNLGVNVAF
ncbi:MAG: autotransporter domain-containing protein [Arenimonas sp.]